METPEHNQHPAAERDLRMYVPYAEGWQAAIRTSGTDNEYCSSKNPDEDFFHLILRGEVFLQFGDQKYCLNCAYRNGVVTHNRLFWQRGGELT